VLAGGQFRLKRRSLRAQRFIHWIGVASLLGLSVLMIGHIYITFPYDAFSAMRTGFVTEEYARMEHRRWLETLPPEAFAGTPEAPKTPEVKESDTTSTAG
jgi:cytochrome b subunit of formate dehydrogenase